eukprot:CAMPEP_0202503894 /NCGR_PEP_ID=MMETSP1361-20130828/43078_1 /ASSEMBLY_ACC=CAM_ASM_000849 /TAXON_ID=210615 /ORGANISM="Staurosira complex sp., Strain CCMP2646" /LENGTH=87 /DNA_ID=CAMNT_0049137257 /DNA_START=114 /DNA_END=373 /DNA_ORIENTATION=-
MVQAGSPPFCNNLDCPVYTVVTKTAQYEIRKYAPSVWSSTNVTSVDSYNDATREGFQRLFKYISGANTNGTKVPMAAPVLVDVYPGA